MAINWILRGKPFWTCCIPLRIKPKQTADKRWELLKCFRVSFARPKIGSRS